MEIKKIILNGCSYTHGCDLTFEKNKIPRNSNFFEVTKSWTKSQLKEFNSLNLGGRLSESLECKDIINLARPGFSNEYISSSTIDYIETNWDTIDPQTTLILIGWTDFCRTVIYTETLGAFHYSFPLVDSYIDNFLKEEKKTQDILKRIKFLKTLDPLQQYYLNDVYCTNTDYYRHINLILMLQFYLNSKGLKYIFWNSLINLPRMSLNQRENLILYRNIENIVDWSRWAPDFNKESYEKSWEELIINDQKYLTYTSHPSVMGVQLWADILTEKIKLRY